MQGLRVVSADSHVMEPPDLWVERLDRKLRDRAPKVVALPNKPGAYFVADGLDPTPVSAGFAAGKSGEALREHMQHGYEAARPSGWDPAERIKDQEIDGVEAEVLYATLGLFLFGLDDAELQTASIKVYNDWLAEYCAYNPKRLYGMGLLPLDDIDASLKELERVHKMGMRGALIWGAPPVSKPYTSSMYDRLWQAASELRMPLGLHVFTGRSKDTELKLDNVCVRYTFLIHEIQRTFASLIFGGVLDRFPNLRLVSAENDTGWLPHFMYRIDHAYEKYGKMDAKTLPMKPSEYLRRQVWATFQDDPIGPMTHQVFGADNYMWGSDFPHADSTWPNSRASIAKDFVSVPDAITRKIVFENAVKLYRMNFDQEST
jgi:uncharacterized protein